MKIDQSTGSATPLRLPVKGRTAAGGAPAGPEAVPAQGATNVRSFPEPADGTFDAAKVAAIREQIRSGQYRINPERIAEGLLASVRDLIPGGKG